MSKVRSVVKSFRRGSGEQKVARRETSGSPPSISRRALKVRGDSVRASSARIICRS
jgi:hypothetical protein